MTHVSTTMLMALPPRGVLSSILRLCAACCMLRHSRAWPSRLCAGACARSLPRMCNGLDRDSTEVSFLASSAYLRGWRRGLRPDRVRSLWLPRFSCDISYIMSFIMSTGKGVGISPVFRSRAERPRAEVQEVPLGGCPHKVPFRLPRVPIAIESFCLLCPSRGYAKLTALSGIDALVGDTQRKPSGQGLWQRRSTGIRVGRVASCPLGNADAT